MATHRMFLPGESQGQRSLLGTVHGAVKGRTGLSAAHSTCCLHPSGGPGGQGRQQNGGPS